MVSKAYNCFLSVKYLLTTVSFINDGFCEALSKENYAF